jgi:outer membrane protein assembly factor BamB
MKRIPFVLGVILAFSAPATSADDEKVTHRFAAAVQGKIAIFDKDGKIEWETTTGKYVAHDLQVLDNGNILYPKSANQIVEVDRKGQTVWEYRSRPADGGKGTVEVHAFQRLADGNTMIAETGNKRIIEIDRAGKIVVEVPLQVDKPDAHYDTRLVRKLDNGNYLVCHENDGAVREYDKTGKVVWKYKLDLGGREKTPGHDGHGTQVYGALRLANGNTLIAGGNNNRVLEVDKDGKIVWKIDHDELKGIKLYWVTSLHVLPNGNVVIGNTHAGKDNPQLIEVTRDKKVVWTFNQFGVTGNDLCAVQLLDVKGKVIR